MKASPWPEFFKTEKCIAKRETYIIVEISKYFRMKIEDCLKKDFISTFSYNNLTNSITIIKNKKVNPVHFIERVIPAHKVDMANIHP
jgi:hypothetical protein